MHPGACLFRGTALLLALLAGLAGCATPPEQETPPQDASAPPAISPDVRKDYGRALKLMKKERYAQAEPLLRNLIQRAPQLAGPHTNLGIVYARTGRPKEAEQAFLKAIELKPDSAPAYNQLGILYREAGRFKEARDAYEKALAIDPDYAYAHLNLGITFDLYLQQPRLALKHYEDYQRLQKKEDKEVKLWIIDLQRRLEAQP